jgi:hypothetical protein
VEAKVSELREAVASEDPAKMKAGMEALQQEAMKMGQAMYASGQAAAGGAAPGGGAPDAEPGPGPAGGKGPDDVIDAEFSDKK